MKLARRVMSIVLWSATLPASAQPDGSICLASGAFDAFAKGGATVEQYEDHAKRPATGAELEAVRFVQVDGMAPVRVSSATAGRITGIAVDGKHTVRISKHADMKDRVASFTFTFRDQGSNALCLWYGSFYGSWMLQPLKGSVCRCK